jgi:hypothetical protein
MATFSTDTPANDTVKSPCINVCTLDPDDVCLGCYRNVAEICAWASADNDERRQIVAAAAARLQASERRA